MKKSKMTHLERLSALVRNEPLDRLPIALWRHFPVDDQDANQLAAATLHFQDTYDFDLIKVTPSSSFCLNDWGTIDLWEGNPEGTRRYSKHVIQSPSDWDNLKPLDPKSGFLVKQLECLKLLQDVRKNTPIIQTIFNPLAQAKNLAGSETLLTHLRLYPDALTKGLATITYSTRKFIEAAMEVGIDGIFYAIQHAQSSMLSKEEYKVFGNPYDLALLDHASSLSFNILHLHGNDVYFDEILNYPIQILNWHDRETYPSLSEAKKHFPGIVCGGMRRETISLGNPEMIRAELQDAVKQVNSERLLLGTGCVVPTIAPHGNLMTARKWVEDN